MANPISLSVLKDDPRIVDYCFFISALEGGGAETVLLELIGSIVARGKNVDLLVLEHRGALKDRVPENTRYITLGRNIKARPALYSYLEYLCVVRPKSVVANLENPTLLALVADLCSSHKHRLYIRVDGNMFWHRRNRRLVARPVDLIKFLLARLLYPRAKLIFTVSEGLRNRLVSSLGLRECQVRTILNPVSPPIVHRQTSEKRSFAKIVAVGRLVPEKDYPTLLRAFSLVREQVECSVVILGEGSMRKKLEKLVVELKLEKDVTLPGFLEDVTSILGSADLFVLSSVSEGLPTALIEALMLKMRIVSTDCDYGPSEILQDGKFGTLIPVGDTQAMASGIIQQLNDPVHFSDIELEQHLQKFDIEQVTSRYLCLMENQTSVSRELTRN